MNFLGRPRLLLIGGVATDFADWIESVLSVFSVDNWRIRFGSQLRDATVGRAVRSPPLDRRISGAFTEATIGS